MKTSRKVFIHISVLLMAKYTFAQQDWKLAKEEKGIKVYLRDHPGRKIKEFKAVTTFENVSLDFFYKLFKDGNQASKWSYSVSYSHTLATPTPTDDIVYYQIDTPWPIQSRDVVQKQSMVWKDNNTEIVCYSYSLPDYIPAKKGFVRVEESSVTWTFRRKSTTQVEVIYEFFTDPKIPIPDNIVQYFIVNGPIFVFEKLRNYHRKTHTSVTKGVAEKK